MGSSAAVQYVCVCVSVRQQLAGLLLFLGFIIGWRMELRAWSLGVWSMCFWRVKRVVRGGGMYV